MYELAYHLNLDAAEEAITRMRDFEQLIATQGGSVMASREPKKTHLSYPIKHQHYGLFGTVDFTMDAEKLDAFTSQLKLESNILRFLILHKPGEGKELRILGDRSRKARHGIATHHPAVPESKPKQEEKVIEKELESVLEKL